MGQNNCCCRNDEDEKAKEKDIGDAKGKAPIPQNDNVDFSILESNMTDQSID